MTTRRKFGMGIAAMLAAQRAPAALVRSLVAGRQIAATGTRPPYAEVEYLESNGTQWIDTRVVGMSPCRFRGSFAYTELQDNGIIIGAVNTNQLATMAIYGIGQYPRGNNFIRVGNSYQSFGNVPLGTAEKFDVIISSTNAVVMSGGVQVAQISVSANQNVGANLYLFAINRNGFANFHAKAKVLHFQIYVGESLVRDFVPVRFTNEIGQSDGAMYDRVSGQLFRNQGTGAFVIGPVKARGASGQNGGGYKWLIVLNDSGPSWRPCAQSWRQSPSLWKEAA